MSDKTVRIIQNKNKQNKTEYYKNQQEHIDRHRELGFVNPETGAFLGLKSDGEMVQALDLLNQNKKSSQNGMEVAPEKTEILNRKSLIVDDILVNHQKFNTQLLKLSDTSRLFDYQTIGGLTLNGTVMVKVWEKNLGRYVLMRRPIRTPLFGRTLEAPEISELLDFDIANVSRLNRDLAEYIKLEREKATQVTDEMQDVTGGSDYDQGDYNNYTDDFNANNNADTDYSYQDTDINNSFASSISIKEMLLPLGSNRRSGEKLKGIQGITIHGTGNSASALNERKWLENPDNNASNRSTVAWHLCIDEDQCIMAIPLDEVAHHAGDSKGNTTTFSIEIREIGGNREKIMNRAATLTAQLMRKYNLNINQIYRHYDWSGKACPGMLMANNWAGWKSFINLVKQKLEESALVNTNPNRNQYCWPCPGAKIVTAKMANLKPHTEKECDRDHRDCLRKHDGWDISESDALNKNIPICASRAGIVEVANQSNGGPGNWNGYGACVVINHGEGIKTLYAHMKNNSVTVKKGDKVKQGQKLGIMGNTGSVIAGAGGTGCHLHFSIYQYDANGKKTPIDPEGIIDSNS